MSWMYPLIMACAVATGWVVSRRTPPSHAALRILLPPGRRSDPDSPPAPGPVSRPAHQALHHRLSRIPVPDRVHSPGAALVAGLVGVPVVCPGDVAGVCLPVV